MPKLTSDIRDSIVAHNLNLVSASKMEVTDEMMLLAQRLSLIHGRIRVTNEASGIHFYMPSPVCLEEYGAAELDKMHLAVNVEKYFTEGVDRCGLCMKTSTPYNVSDLESMPPMSERGFNVTPEVLKVSKANMDYMEQDINGAWIPKGPGEVVPVYQLPKEHPAQYYLRSRGFDAEALYQQFRLSYCEKERSDIFYKRMLNGFRATPQGRIVFFIDIDGINRGWQSRILEYEHQDFKYYFHPYSKQWVKVLKKVGDKWRPTEPIWEGWDDVKYCISAGAKRNACLLGFDAAVEYNRRHNQATGNYWCVLAEGGLDAGRIGPPGVAMMGKAFSIEQAQLLASEFKRIIYVADIDAAGAQAAATVQKRLAAYVGPIRPSLKIISPSNGKDLGCMEPSEAKRLIESNLWT